MIDKLPKGFRMERGLVWPAMDTACAKVIFSMQRDLEVVLPYVTNFDACIQAGGNCGVWARALAPKFGTVYTVEPDHMNFTALAINTAGLHNVVRMQAALGDARGMVSLALADHETENCGAYFVQEGGRVPTLRVDDLALPSCGLLYLDIEGFELNALHGAASTIALTRPTIVIEDKGLSDKYGTPKGACEAWLAEAFGYHVAKRVNRDVILVPA